MNEFIRFFTNHAGVGILVIVLFYMLYVVLRDPESKDEDQTSRKEWRRTKNRLCDNEQGLKRDAMKALTDISKAIEESNKNKF